MDKDRQNKDQNQGWNWNWNWNWNGNVNGNGNRNRRSSRKRRWLMPLLFFLIFRLPPCFSRRPEYDMIIGVVHTALLK